jgi:hypothetical protein
MIAATRQTSNLTPAQFQTLTSTPKSAVRGGGLTDLNNALVQRMVKQNVQNFFRGIARARPCSAPMNPERFQNVDVTPKFEMGVGYRAYNINGELMVAVTPVTRQGGKPTWYDLGKVPAADVVAPAAPHNCWDPSTWTK